MISFVGPRLGKFLFSQPTPLPNKKAAFPLPQGIRQSLRLPRDRRHLAGSPPGCAQAQSRSRWTPPHHPTNNHTPTHGQPPGPPASCRLPTAAPKRKAAPVGPPPTTQPTTTPQPNGQPPGPPASCRLPPGCAQAQSRSRWTTPHHLTTHPPQTPRPPPRPPASCRLFHGCAQAQSRSRWTTPHHPTNNHTPTQRPTPGTAGILPAPPGCAQAQSRSRWTTAPPNPPHHPNPPAALRPRRQALSILPPPSRQAHSFLPPQTRQALSIPPPQSRQALSIPAALSTLSTLKKAPHFPSTTPAIPILYIHPNQRRHQAATTQSSLANPLAHHPCQTHQTQHHSKITPSKTPYFPAFFTHPKTRHPTSPSTSFNLHLSKQDNYPGSEIP
jgi:hypothetical protein